MEKNNNESNKGHSQITTQKYKFETVFPISYLGTTIRQTRKRKSKRNNNVQQYQKIERKKKAREEFKGE